MSTFHGFPELPRSGDVPFCEVNGVYCCANQDLGCITTFTNATKNHPSVNVARDHHFTRDEGISMYLETEDNLFKRLTSVMYNEGFHEAMKTAADPRVNNEYPILASIASFLLQVTNRVAQLRYCIQPHLKDIGPKMIAKYSRTRNWQHAPIRCIAWHPHTTKIAVASSDDTVRVFREGSSTLKCPIQKNISSMAWRPCCAAELAVGCERGAVLLVVDPGSVFTKPSTSNAQVLERSGHSPVTDVSWSPEGDLLLTASACDPTILVWDVCRSEAACLKRVAGGGTVMTCFSHDGGRLFSATTSLVFRVWDSEKKWNVERWYANNRVSCAAWGPQRALLFAAEGEPIVYALNIGLYVYNDDNDATSRAQPLLNLEKVELNNGEVVGGPILDLKWDPKGRHLAVMFTESHIIAIFNTTNSGTQLQVTPCCFVCGANDEIPSVIDFQKNFSEGSCLTIGWSSGRLQYFPIIYSEGFQ